MEALKSFDNDINEENGNEYLIAWIEKNYYGDIADFKYDLMELAGEVGFEITRIDVEKSPNNGFREVIKAYTDTYSKTPSSMKGIVKKWLVKLSWSNFVFDLGVSLE